MLALLRDLIQALNTNNIRYCHWKSNMVLAQTLMGQTDVDLLVDRRNASSFRVILAQLGFRSADVFDGGFFPAVEHYIALDEDSGTLVDVHAYYRVITGESLTKNYRLPIEEMLLQNTREVDSVRVPLKGAELVVFTLRMMLKHTSVTEFALLARDWKHVTQEIAWLLEGNSLEQALNFVHCWLPSIDANLFSSCVDALKSPVPISRRVQLGFLLSSRLRLHRRHSALGASLTGMAKFTTMLIGRLTGHKQGMALRSGGAVIAFVGPEATGKSTLLAEVSRWLGGYFTVDRFHAGKPKSTPVTLIPNLFVPALRRALPTLRSGHIETQDTIKEPAQKTTGVYPLIFALRSMLLGYDRRALLVRAHREAANGAIVLCDRYPSLESGRPDSPQLYHLPIDPDKYPLRSLLARMERRFYGDIPAPDLVIVLTVPVEVAILRNQTRGKREPEEYVRQRHARGSALDFGRAPICHINTDRPFEETILEVKKAIWSVL